ncbi:MAG: SH3 domain-containing protein [Deltaproteobacteria bacterium]|nr:SH3 domain-containing protein [Deltaproteobacteria bacterium]
MKLAGSIIVAILICSPWVAGAACVEGDCTNGYGTAVLPYGGKYVGEFREGVRAGSGSMAYPDGARYEGSWQNDRPHGKGTLFSAGKFEYKGEFAKGARHGQGTLKIIGGKTYEGEWQDDAPHGQGTLTDPGKEEFTGQFANGRRYGQGESLYFDGSRYKGEWADDLPNGQGVKIMADGMQYSGEFRNGLMFGSGTIVLPDGHQLKVKWQADSPPQKGHDLPETAVSGAAAKREWYMVATPAKDQKPFSLGPAPSAGPVEITREESGVAVEIPPRESRLPGVSLEDVSPRIPEKDEVASAEPVRAEKIPASGPAATGPPVKLPPRPPAEDKLEAAEQLQAETTTANEPTETGEKKPAEYASIAVGANIRSAASLTAKILRTVPAGYPVAVLEKQPEWFLVKDFRERKGWVFASLVAEPGTVIIRVFKGNLRSGPGLQDDIIAQLDHGTIMSVLARSGEWLKVTDAGEVSGWVHREIIWP